MGDVGTGIAGEILRAHRSAYGTGAGRVSVHMHEDVVLVWLDGLEMFHAVIEQRMAFQEVMRERFEAVVQHATGRSVIGFMSGNQQEPDMICEVFVLSPTSLVDEAAARASGKPGTPG